MVSSVTVACLFLFMLVVECLFLFSSPKIKKTLQKSNTIDSRRYDRRKKKVASFILHLSSLGLYQYHTVPVLVDIRHQILDIRHQRAGFPSRYWYIRFNISYIEYSTTSNIVVTTSKQEYVLDICCTSSSSIIIFNIQLYIQYCILQHNTSANNNNTQQWFTYNDQVPMPIEQQRHS